MDIEFYREYCLSKPSVTEETPFGPTALVFKVMGKMFALADLESFKTINLKCDPEKAEELRAEYSGVTPGYHMSKKHWNTIVTDGSIEDKLLLQWTNDSYNLVVAGMPKKVREELKNT